MSEKIVRWGILSAATIGKKNWQAIHLTGNGTVSAVASRSVIKAEDFISQCQKFCPLESTPKAIEGYDQMINDPAIDAIYIPLPTGLRSEWVIKAAEAGKHVMCEKPCAIHADVLQKMTDACNTNRVQFMDGVMYMHSKRMEEIRKVIDNQLGDLRQITAQFSFCGDDGFRSSDIRTDSSLEPQGCLGDLGWYTIRFALWAMNYKMPNKVIGRFLSQHHRESSPAAVPMQVHSELFFENGVHASMYNSFETGHQQLAHVSGTKGHVSLQDFVLPYQGGQANFVTALPEFRVEGCDFEMIPNATVGTVSESANSSADSQETNLFRTFNELVISGQPDSHWPEISLKTQRVMDAIEESGKQGGIEVML